MITGCRNDISKIDSFVIPVDGNYAVPPGKTIETFWSFKRTPDGNLIRDENNMRLMCIEVDPTTWDTVGESFEMTEELWKKLLNTKNHPHFI